MNWKEIVGTVAPLLGGTLGGPFGAMAGKFIADSEGVQEAIGKVIYFGEVLGKHSDVFGELEDTDIKLITDDQKVLEVLKSIGVDISSGYNPIEYYLNYKEDGGYDET